MKQMIGLPTDVSPLYDNPENIRNVFTNQDEADGFFRLLQDRNEVISHEFKAKTIDGGEFWASISARTSYDEKGNPSHYEGSLIDVSEKRDAEDRVRYLAYYDSITGLPNRSLLNDLLNHAIERANRNNELVAVLFLDLNRFKIVNDTLGHCAGDQLLKEVADRLSVCSRGSDWIGRPQSSLKSSPPTKELENTVARLGGDEFVMLLTDIKQSDDSAKIARRVTKSLSAPFTIDNQEVYISASIGISTYPTDSKDASILLKMADSAMYHIKKQGLDGYQFHSDHLDTQAAEKLSLETELRNALKNGEFLLYYQPKLNLNTGRIVGVEALCRWQHTKRGVICPQEFIGLAEEIGFIVPLGEWGIKDCLRTGYNMAGKQPDCLEYFGQYLSPPIRRTRFVENNSAHP